MSRISEALRIAEFPKEAAEYFEEIYERIEADDRLYQHLSNAGRYYYDGGDYSAELKQLEEKSGIHQYTIEMLHLLFCMDRLKGIYRERGYSEALLKDPVADLRYKLEECYAVHGILFYGPKEERIARIKRMEQILDSILSKPIQEAEEELKILTEYYESPLWRADFEADEAGLLPKDLKRGVLSEDAVYNLLMDAERKSEQTG